MRSHPARWLSRAALILLMLPATPAAAQGIFYFVDSAGDGDLVGSSNFCNDGTGHCTLRAAIHASNLHTGEDGIGIDLPAGSVINLTHALPDITQSVGIGGPGADQLTVQRNTGGSYRIFNVVGTITVTLSGMTVRNGLVSASLGGGIANSSGTVNVSNFALSGNSSAYDEQLNMGGGGGAVFNGPSGTVNLSNCTLADNSGVPGSTPGTTAGGAIYNAGTLNLSDCTVTGNSAERGGAIFAESGTLNVTNSTISGNASTGDSAGIYVSTPATVNIKSSIFARNVLNVVTPVVHNFFIAPAAVLTSQGFNLVDNNIGAEARFLAGNPNGNHDIAGSAASPIDPKLDPAGPQSNGGPTQTIALLPGSPAIDKGTSNGLTGHLTTDQRGAFFARTFDFPSISNVIGGDGTDIGAFEVTGIPVSALPPPSAALLVLALGAAVSIRLRRRLLLATVTLLLLPVTPAAAQGIFYSVDSTGDGDLVGSSNFCNDGTGHCTLRAAIHASNLHAGEDGIGIDLPSGSAINLTGALPDITQSVGISGAGADQLTVQRISGGNYRIFNVVGTITVSFFGLTISNALIAGDGGGINLSGSGTVNVSNCRISNNHAAANGGGIANNAGTLNVVNSTLSSNRADAAGGAISNGSGTVNVTNSTLTLNLATGVGSGGAIFSGGALNIMSSTISGNSAVNGGGVFTSGTANVKSSIIAVNTATTASPDFLNSGNAVSHGFNLVGTNAGAALTFPAGAPNASQDYVGTNASPMAAMLDPFGLRNNGGATPTIALLPLSSAIDKGSSVDLNLALLTTDQRGSGFARIVDFPFIGNGNGGDGADIGALESSVAALPVPTLPRASALLLVVALGVAAFARLRRA